MAGGSWWMQGGKRVFDVVAVGVLVPIVLPLSAVCALVVCVFDGLPILFRQARVGRAGRTFELLKFRTMRTAPGTDVTRAGDPRITRLGRRLRGSKLDELPQLWNVLRGDMSLVGPRPEVPRYVALQPRAYRALAALRPGVSDWASIVFRDEERLLAAHAHDCAFYERRLLPRKLALARLYHMRASWLTDLGVCVATVCAAFHADAAARTIIGERLSRRARAGLEAR